MDFKNILIPTDFNEAATHVLPFGKMIAEKLQAGIRLVNVRFSLAGPESVRNMAPDSKLTSPSAARKQEESTAVRETSETTLINSTVSVNFDYKQGLPSQELIKMTSREDIGLVIIGSHGDYDIIDKWIGTVSTDVAMEGRCPVILVPLKAKIKPISHILFATDEAGITRETLDFIMDFAGKVGADVHFIHIRQFNDSTKKGLTEDYAELISGTKFENIPFEINTIRADSITLGLEKYIQRSKMDMLVLVTRKRAGIEHFFHSSFTHKSLFHPWKVPVMVLHA